MQTSNCRLSGQAPRLYLRGAVQLHAQRVASFWRAPATLVVLGLVVLVVGVLPYLTDRSASPTLLIPAVQGLASVNLFGTVGQWLPSFAHTLGFSLFTAAALGPVAAPRHGACAAWCFINVAFEFEQHAQFKTHLADAVQGGWGSTPWSRPLAQYFLRGTFDMADVAAAVAGALAAAAVLSLLHPDVESEHAS